MFSFYLITLHGEVQEEDWQDPCLRYLLDGVLPIDQLKREKLRNMLQDLRSWMGSCSKEASKGNGWFAFPAKS